MALLEAFTIYIKTEKRYAPLTQRAYLTDIKNLENFLITHYHIPLFDISHLPQITHKMLRSWAGSLMKTKMNPKSVARKVAAIRTFFDFTKKSGHITQNPATRLQTPKQDKPLPAFLRHSEVEHLLENIVFPDTFDGARNKCILEILYGCGIRKAELLGLQWADIDFAQKILRIEGKGKKVRLVPFGHHVTQSIENYRQKIIAENQNPAGAFFVNKKGKPLSEKGIYTITRKYLMQVSAPAQQGPHVLRHTYATHLLDAGADLNDIKTLLGHSSLAATQIYTHVSTSTLKNVHNLAHPRAKMKDAEKLE